MVRRVLYLSLVCVCASVGTAFATLPARGPRITASGMVMRHNVGGSIQVSMDTMNFLHNPNNFTVRGVGIAIFDMDGIKVADGQFTGKSGLADTIAPKGVLSTSLGMHLPPASFIIPDIYTFVVSWRKPGSALAPDRGLVANIKELVPPVQVAPAGLWFYTMSSKINAETTLGKGSAGYSSR